MEWDRCLKKRGKKQNLKTIFQKEQNSTRQEKSDAGQTSNFIHFIDQIKERQNNIDVKLFKSYFTYETPDEMV